MSRVALDEFIERQCKLAYEEGERGTWSDGLQQAMSIECAVNKYIETNFKQEVK